MSSKKNNHSKNNHSNTDSKPQINYYDILNLKSNCSKEDIDNAYRTLAMKWHPDKHKGDKDDADKKFKDISRAYQVLSNLDTRKSYDAHGITSNTDKIIDPYAFFKNMMDEYDEDNKVPNVIVKVDAPIDSLHAGFTETITFKRFSPCEKCDSTGTYKKIDGTCKPCKGRGSILETVKGGGMGYMMNEKKCNVCEGKGLDPMIKKCKTCTGNKYIEEEIECEVDIPKGAYDDYYIKTENTGNYIPKDERTNKNKRSDLIVVVKEIPSKKPTPNPKIQ